MIPFDDRQTQCKYIEKDEVFTLLDIQCTELLHSKKSFIISLNFEEKNNILKTL